MSVSSSRRPGCSSASLAETSGIIETITEPNVATRTRPALSPTCADSSAAADSTRPMISVARSASTRPASVSRMPRPTLWNSCAPVSASSRARWWLTEGCEKCSSLAAAVTDPWRATAAKIAQPVDVEHSSTLSMIFHQDRH